MRWGRGAEERGREGGRGGGARDGHFACSQADLSLSVVGSIKLALQLLPLQPAELLLRLGCSGLLPLPSALHLHNHGLILIIIKIIQIMDDDLLTCKSTTTAASEQSVQQEEQEGSCLPVFTNTCTIMPTHPDNAQKENCCRNVHQPAQSTHGLHSQREHITPATPTGKFGCLQTLTWVHCSTFSMAFSCSNISRLT